MSTNRCLWHKGSRDFRASATLHGAWMQRMASAETRTPSLPFGALRPLASVRGVLAILSGCIPDAHAAAWSRSLVVWRASPSGPGSEFAPGRPIVAVPVKGLLVPVKGLLGPGVPGTRRPEGCPRRVEANTHPAQSARREGWRNSCTTPQIVRGEHQRATQLNHHGFLCRGEKGLQRTGRVRSAVRSFGRLPLGSGGLAEAKAP